MKCVFVLFFTTMISYKRIVKEDFGCVKNI